MQLHGRERGLWRAVRARDPRFDGRFVFAVRSTGIYCRPSCPARRPGRARVLFFDAPDAAERAGFRACRRCRPGQAGTRTPWIEAACRLIDANCDEPPGLAALAGALGKSPHHIQRSFKRALGITPRQYAHEQRLRHLRAQLKEDKSVTEAIYEAGFGSASRVYESSGSHLGMTPGTYGRRGAGMRIAYAIVPCPLGRLLVAATHRGLCAASLGDSQAALEAGLRAEYAAAELQRDDEGLGRYTRAVLRHLEGREPRLDLPLDIRATAFERQVFEALRKIPYGATRSYSEVARAIGRPSAARAVARACSRNPVALVVPCHRVLPQAGGTGGYRWGVERKRALLRGELSRRGGSCRGAGR